MAAAAVPDLKLFPFGERTHESDELVHREARVWSDVAVDLEDSTETLGPLDAQALEPGAGRRRERHDLKDPSECPDGGGFGSKRRGPQECRDPIRCGPARTPHVPQCPVVSVKEMSDPRL